MGGSSLGNGRGWGWYGVHRREERWEGGAESDGHLVSSERGICVCLNVTAVDHLL